MKIGPFPARPEIQFQGQKAVSSQQGNGVHSFALYVADGRPVFAHHELSWHPTEGHKDHIKRAHIAYEVFGDPRPPSLLPEVFDWRNDRWAVCLPALLSEAVPQPSLVFRKMHAGAQ